MQEADTCVTRGVLKRPSTYFSCNLAVDEPTSVKGFYQKSGTEPGEPTPRKIKTADGEKEISLPIIAAWPKSKEQYLEEFQQAGFNVVKITREDARPVGDCWVISARRLSR